MFGDDDGGKQEMLWWILVGIAAIVAVYVVRKYLQFKTPAGFARQISTVQVFAFYGFQNKYPNVPRKELYQIVISQRPGWDAERISELIHRSESMAAELSVELRFWMVVSLLVVDEYYATHGIYELPVSEITAAVRTVVPSDL